MVSVAIIQSLNMLTVTDHVAPRFDDGRGIDAILATQGLLRTMFNKSVMDAQAVDKDISNAAVAQQFKHRAAETTVDGIFFNRNDAADLLGQREDQVPVDGLDESGVDDGCLDAVIC